MQLFFIQSWQKTWRTDILIRGATNLTNIVDQSAPTQMMIGLHSGFPKYENLSSSESGNLFCWRARRDDKK